ncbi:hypothetical protein RZ760_012175 [Providencia rettgeri]|nr:hypothetical protein [Providencia rettgeri]
MEKASLKFKKDLHCYLDLNNIEATCTQVDIINNEINTITSNYGWLLSYWGKDLDLCLNERLIPGFKLWSNYSDHYNNKLLNKANLKCRADLCIKYGNIYEIISFKLKGNVSNKDIMYLYRIRGVLSEYAKLNWYGKDKVSLPLRIDVTENVKYTEEDKIYFGDFYLTRKEFLSVKLLLLNKSIDEISTIQGNGTSDELNRLDSIMKRLKGSAKGDIIKTFRHNGITLPILNAFSLYP